MQKEISQLKKLIDRKREYLQRIDNTRTRDAVSAEITILQNSVDAMESSISVELLNQISISEKEYKMQDAIRSLEAICMMHGINDYPIFYQKGFPVLIGTLKELTRKQEVIIPNQLKLTYEQKD